MPQNYLIKTGNYSFRINAKELEKAENAYLTHDFEFLNESIKCKKCCSSFINYECKYPKIGIIKKQYKTEYICYLTCNEIIIKGLLE